VNTEYLRTILEAAVHAPSVHNTQPWRFVVCADPPDGSPTIDVFADRERQLSVIDPAGRELHIGCGAAIEFARVGARATGRACAVSLLPDAANSDHLARIEVGGALLPSPEEAELGRAIPLRYTDRGPFDDRVVPPQVMADLHRSANAYEAWIRSLDRPGDEVAAIVLLARADEIERGNPAYESELAAWTGPRPGARDGIPPSAVPMPPVAERGSSYKLREFAAGDQSAAPSTSDEQPPPAEHPLVVVLGTVGDDTYAWLQAGQALGRLLLTAAAAGVSASPMTQVLEIEATRAQLAGRLGLLGHPQVVLRVGYGHGHATTPRRSIDEVTTWVDGHPARPSEAAPPPVEAGR
jgi:nitroreductase